MAKGVDTVDNIKNKLVNRSLILLSVFMLPVLLASVQRYFLIGFQSIFVIHTLFALIVLLVLLFRHKIKYVYKAGAIITLFYLLGILSLYNFGVQANATYIFLTTIYLSIIFFNRTLSLTLFTSTIAFYALYLWADHYALIPTHTVPANKAEVISFGINKIVGFTAFGALGILVVDYIFRKLNASLHELTIKNENLNKLSSEVAASREKYRLITENTLDGIFTANSNGELTYASPSLLAQLGYPKEFVLSLNNEKVYQLVHPDDRDRVFGQINEAIRTGLTELTYSFRIKRADNTYIWREDHANLLFDSNGNYQSSYVICRDITEKKRANMALKESEQRFRAVFEQSAAGIAIIDNRQNIIEANEAFCSMLGYSKNEICQLSVKDITYQENIEQEYQQIADQLRNGHDRFNVEKQYVKKDGSIIWANLSTTVLRDEKGDVQSAMGVVLDISRQKMAEQELIAAKNRAQENETRFKTFTAQSNDGITVTDLQGNYVYVNPAFCKMSGYTEAELLGMKAQQMRAPQEEAGIYEKSIGHKEGQPLQVYLQRKDGSVYTTQIVAKKIRLHKQDFALGTIRDITNEVQKEKELLAAKERAEQNEFKVRSMFENNLTGFLYFDTQGKLLEANPAVLRIIGSPSLEQTQKINLLEFKPLVDVGFSPNARKCIAERKVVADDAVYTSVWGKQVYMKYFLIPIVINNKVEGVWANLQDLTDLWNTQKQLIDAKEQAQESDRLKSSFLKSISHEVRTPINAILGFSDILLDKKPPPDKLQRFSRVVHQSINKLLLVSDNIITMAHLETNQLKIQKIVFSPDKLINELNDEYQILKSKLNKPEVELTTAIQSADTISIHSDYTQLKHVFRILLDNALKFTESGRVEFGYRLHDDHIEFFVSDTGMGIPAHKQELIFKRFTHADDTIRKLFGGVGLGLAIARSLVNKLQGSINMQSEPGQGTRFAFDIPISNTQTTQQETMQNKITPETGNAEKPATVARKVRLLVAEDEELNYMLIEELLYDHSVELTHAFDGQQAVELFRQQEFDLILMDIKMPVLDGFGATEQIRQTGSQIPIIAQTAYSFKREECLTAGFSDYMSKPFSESQLVSIIEKHAGRTI